MVLSRSLFCGSTRLIFAAATAAAAISVAAGNAAAGGRAEDAAEPNPDAMAGFNVSAGARAPADRGIPAYSGVPADPSGAAHPSVSVDLSVIDEPGTGPVRRTLTRPDGLRMPVPGVFPQSRLHEPDPDTLPYATLTPPRQRAVNLRPPGSSGSTPRIRALALANPSPPPRPEEPVPIPRPGAANTSIGQEPVAITAPSRTAEMVAPASQSPQSLSPEDAVPPSPAPAASTDAATALAATDPVAITPPFSGTSSSESVLPLAEPASAPQVSPEPTNSSPPPQVQQASLSSSPIAPELESQTETTPESDLEKAATPPTPSKTEKKIVALQPAARSEEAMPPPAEEFIATGELVQVAFDAADTDMTGGSRAELKELAERLRSQENMRLQLLAYAEGEGLSPSKARRISLSRALTVRSYLIENGIKTSRIDVRALGNKATSAPLDRVDVKVVQR